MNKKKLMVINIKKLVLLMIAIILVLIPSVIAPVWYGSSDDSGLVGHWACEGNFLDSSGQGNNGTQSGGVKIGAGIKGRGCEFDGKDDYISANSPITVNNNYTISIWFQVHTNEVDKGLFSIADSYESTGPILLIQADDGTLKMYNGGYTNIDSINENQWYNVVVAYNGTNQISYLNGNYKSIRGNTTKTQDNYVYIGSGYQGQFNGTIDEVRVYNRSLSATEISSLYNTSKSYHFRLKTTPQKGLKDESGLVGHWTFDSEDGSNSTNATDISGQGNHGTVNGATFTNEGKFKEGYSFDGNNDVISLSSLSVDTTAKHNNTVSFWMYRLPGGGDSTFSMPFGFSAYDLGFYGNYNAFGFNTGAGDLWGINDTGLFNNWVHVVGQFYNGDIRNNTKLYINGVEQTLSQKAGTSGSKTVTTSAVISGWTGNANYKFNGTIDEVRIYNRSLSASEIADLYNGTKSYHFRLKTIPSLGINNETPVPTMSNETPEPTISDETGLVGYWTFNSADGSNSTNATNSSRWNEGYSFAHDDKYIILDNFGGVDNDFAKWFNKTRPWTISSWVKPEQISSSTGFVVTMQGWDTGSGFWDYGSPSWRLVLVNTTNNGFAVYGGTVNYGQWYHLVTTFNGTEGILYVDGVKTLNETISPDGLRDYTNSAIYISDRNARDWNGEIDEVRIYNRSLSASEVKELYLSKGLVGHWNLNSNANDSSGYYNNGTVVGATYTSDARWDGGYSFDGISGNDYIIADDDGDSFGKKICNYDGCSFCAWINTKDVSTAQYIISRNDGTSSNQFFQLRINDPGKIYSKIYGDGSTTFSSSASGSSNEIKANQWHHVCAVFNGSTTVNGTISNYLDGTVSATSGNTVKINSTGWDDDEDVLIGAGDDGSFSGNFNGTIDEVKIFNRALTASEIKELYLSSGLVGHWTFDSKDGSDSTTAKDISKYNNDGTVTGADLTNEGKFKEGYEFDGINGDIEIDFCQELNLTNNLTISAWFKPKSFASTHYLIGKGTTAATTSYLLYQGTDDLWFRVGNGTGAPFSKCQGSIKQNKWYHAVGVFNGTTLTTYMDGGYCSQGAFDGNVYGGNYNIFLGAKTTDNSVLNGTLDEVKIYNRALSASEVAGLYNGTKTRHFRLKSVPG